MANQIIISKGATTITMPRVKAVTVGGAEEAKTSVMASGKVVKDIVGYRATVNATWDYVPANIMAALHTQLRQGGFFTVTYPDPTCADLTKIFSIECPSSGIFCFKNGVAMWHGVTLNMTAQGVN